LWEFFYDPRRPLQRFSVWRSPFSHGFVALTATSHDVTSASTTTVLAVLFFRSLLYCLSTLVPFLHIPFTHYSSYYKYYNYFYFSYRHVIFSSHLFPSFISLPLFCIFLFRFFFSGSFSQPLCLLLYFPHFYLPLSFFDWYVKIRVCKEDDLWMFN
jgi:hypothetical protein